MSPTKHAHPNHQRNTAGPGSDCLARVGRDAGHGHLGVLLRVLGRVVGRVAVGARVGHLVLEHLDELVEDDGQQGTNSGTDPWDTLSK